jgi:DNA-binding GntR family transcriptional regulator
MPVTKHTTLATELEKDILSGKYGWEGGLPSASELAQTWNMSINTVKNALSLLEGKNLIEKRGIAYYVNRVPTIMTQYVPHANLRIKDRPGYCKNIGPVKKIAVPEHLAKKLNIPQSQTAVYRVQVSGEFTEGNERPLQLTYRYHMLQLPEQQIQQMQNNANYDPMRDESTTATELDTYDEVVPRLATEGERDLLDLPETTPILAVLEVIRHKESNDLLMFQEVILSPRTTLIFEFPFLNQKP